MSCASFRSGTNLEFEISSYFQGNVSGPRGLSFAFREYPLVQMKAQLSGANSVEVETYLTAEELLLPIHYFLSSQDLSGDEDTRVDLILDAANGRIDGGFQQSLTLPLVVEDVQEDSFVRFELEQDRLRIHFILSSDALKAQFDWLRKQTTILRVDADTAQSKKADPGDKFPFVVSLKSASVSQLIRWVATCSASGAYPAYTSVLEQLTDIEIVPGFAGVGQVRLKVGFGRKWKHYKPIAPESRREVLANLSARKRTGNLNHVLTADAPEPKFFERLIRKIGL